MATVYGFKERKDAETLRDIARRARPGTTAHAPRLTDTGGRTFVCTPADTIPAAQNVDGSVLPGSGIVTIYEMDDDEGFKVRMDEGGSPLKLTAYNLGTSAIEPGGSPDTTFYLVTEDSFGRLFFFFRPSTETAVTVTAKGFIFSWLIDAADEEQKMPILANEPADFSFYLNGSTEYPAEKVDAEFTAAEITADGRLWRWVETRAGWYCSERLSDGTKYCYRGGVITPEPHCFGGTFTGSEGSELYPAEFGTGTFWKSGSVETNLYSSTRYLVDGEILEGYMAAYQTDIPTEPTPGTTYTATPTAEFTAIDTTAASFTLRYDRSVFQLTGGEWTDSNGKKKVFGVPVWKIGEAEFSLEATADGTQYRLAGELSAGGKVYRNLTWDENRGQWTLGVVGSADGWYSVQSSALEIADGWKFSGNLEYQQNEDADEETRDPLRLTYDRIDADTFQGSALLIRPERFTE